MKRLAILLLPILFLTSCESETFYIWQVTNNSSTEIIVLFDAEMPSYSSQTTVPVGLTETIGTDVSDGSVAPASPSSPITDMIIINATDTSDKDFRIEANWLVSQEADGRDNNIYFSFEVDDADF